ncbi:ABC transporter permease [Ferrovibrio terrae]|uniref:ABC transporter permease n=1 Tax=Ferrovibrio terrae TaxID=2594003 RepID=A0A516H4B6_9PROT|nr:ABC transporter permease [Ferrovibrio terrae]QDO98623.1 ABC transporter permease [Ferrovibrio terrae]
MSFSFGAILRSWVDSDLAYSFRRSPAVVVSAVVALTIILAAVLAPLVSPFNPFNPAAVKLMDAFTPPAWTDEGQLTYLLGTDDQGRDLFSTLLYGSRISLLVGFSAIAFAAVFGTLIGVLCGYRGGWLDIAVMRVADVQLTIPNILIALTIDGIARTALPRELHNEIAIFVLIFAIGIADWPQFARVARSAALVERHKDYVSAARVIGQPSWVIVLRHVLPNTLGPVLVLATVGLALAVLAEATLSFLGVGVPPTQPSLGTLIRVGQSFLFSGEWWITFFPALTLVLLVLAVNVLGDWLRDALNPKLR